MALSDLLWDFKSTCNFCESSKSKHQTKGYKYFVEQYITDVRVVLDGQPDDNGSPCAVYYITSKCHRSMRKNEPPHHLSCFITCQSDRSTSEAHHASCSCSIGSSGCCGHIIGLLFQLADYKTRNLAAVPDPVPCTALPQQWHKPRGQKVEPVKIDCVQLSSPALGRTKSRAICSTAYNPVAGIDLPNFTDLTEQLIEIKPNSQWLNMHIDNDFSSESTRKSFNLGAFGASIHGSVLSYQQASDNHDITNIPGVMFPSLPVCNVMLMISFVPTDIQAIKLSELYVTEQQVIAFEIQTQQQSDSSLWHSLRKSRITASKVGSICKRKGDPAKLCCQLKRTVRSTPAMKAGLVREPFAADAYGVVMDSRVNLYPCGLIISSFVPWLAASPDRKVYCQDRNPPFGLLEIKCSQAESLDKVVCLADNGEHGLKLKKSHDYHYQVQCQMAVTGLSWCDFMVYLENGDMHVETVNFDAEFWHEAELKLHNFFFNFFAVHDS